jgi:hypothetical protein
MGWRGKTCPRVVVEAVPVTPTRYRIVVKGRISESFASVFDGLTVEPLPGRTSLEGVIADQSQLHGVLDRLRGLGIELVSVNALD